MNKLDISKEPNTPPVGSPDHPPLITVTNAPKAPAEAAAKFDINREKTAQPAAVNADATGEKPKTETVSSASSNQATNENSKSANSDSDFSEIFTEDTEETEATRLAKELDEIDTDALLQTSQDLMLRFKRK